MTLAKKLYDVLAVGTASAEVLSGSVKIVAGSFRHRYDQTVFGRTQREADEFWHAVDVARDSGHSEPDIYELARAKQAQAAANVGVHREVGTSSGLDTAGTRRPQLKPEAIRNVRNYTTSTPGVGNRGNRGNRRNYATKAAKKAVEDAMRKPRRQPKGKTVSPDELMSPPTPPVQMTSSSVPSSRLERLFHYGALAAGVGMGIATESLKHYSSGTKPQSARSLIMSASNIERMAKKFSRMRGAALKIGQLMSFQDNQILPPEIQQILLRVQNSAHYMPPAQLHQVISAQLGPNWRAQHFASFEDVPIAAASIGQVHRAVTKDLTSVVMKVQYPGVADSIDSDLNNLGLLLTASRMLPAGLFLDKTIDNARLELKWECDYLREASNMIRFKELVAGDDVFAVPRVLNELSGEHILTMEEMKGVEIVKGDWDQETKNWIASNIMRLCLTEIAQFKFMQTDPNWANFLYNAETGKIELLDFGASREFGQEFIGNYVSVLRCAIKKDRAGIKEFSEKLGYLTGLETPGMTEAHIDSVMVLGEAFSPADNNGKAFDFSNQTITDRVRSNIGLMLNERLTPPPEETYSLHRKLSGVFLLCARLQAQVNCEQIFREVVGYE